MANAIAAVSEGYGAAFGLAAGPVLLQTLPELIEIDLVGPAAPVASAADAGQPAAIEQLGETLGVDAEVSCGVDEPGIVTLTTCESAVAVALKASTLNDACDPGVSPVTCTDVVDTPTVPSSTDCEPMTS